MTLRRVEQIRLSARVRVEALTQQSQLCDMFVFMNKYQLFYVMGIVALALICAGVAYLLVRHM